MSHFFRYQKRAAEHFDADHSTMEDFATVLNGFPPEATDPTLLQAWIEKTCGFKIVGVSIGYNFTLDQSRVADMIERHTIVNDIAVGLYGKDDELAYDTTGDKVQAEATRVMFNRRVKERKEGVVARSFCKEFLAGGRFASDSVRC